MDQEIASFDATVTRLGTALEPSGDPRETEGVLNPAAARTRDGKLLLYPRAVAEGNISRIAIVEVRGSPEKPVYERIGYALEPNAPYEFRTGPGGYGCEDPRVTFIPALDAYAMAYTAFGPDGPRVAFALSHDGYAWERVGLADFSGPGLSGGDDKDGAFFPEPVRSPRGVMSIAFYHRPTLHLSAVDGRAAVPVILAMPAKDRESACLAYVPLEPVLEDRRNLLRVAESHQVLAPQYEWEEIKTGAGTPPVRVSEGWLSVYHGVMPDPQPTGRSGLRYSAGIVIHDFESPDIVLYRSPKPILVPETLEERRGIVSDVVFPTGIDRLDGDRNFDIYYGMADARVGRARLQLGASALAPRAGSAESAA
jgi:beta-1,2-mannobiose phosphorylase / 1,2-beta-oligomannan phosphorylase